MIYVIAGKDDYQISEALKKIKSGLGDESMLKVNTTVLSARDATPEEIRAAVATVPFMAEKRLVIIEGLFSYFSAGRQPSKKKMKSSKHTSGKLERYLESISNVPESTVVVLVDGDVKTTNPLLKAISPEARIHIFPLKKQNDLVLWINHRVTVEKGTISPRAAALLASMIGNNLWIMSNEITKLLLYCHGRSIEEKDVQLMVSNARESSVFALVDAIMVRNLPLAQKTLQELLLSGAAPVYLLFMIVRQLRLIVRIKELLRQKLARPEIQRRLGIKADFAYRKTQTQARSFELPRIKEIYQLLLEADITIKTGRYDGELALSLLITDICQTRKDATGISS